MKKQVLTSQSLKHTLDGLGAGSGDGVTVYATPASFPSRISGLLSQTVCAEYVEDISKAAGIEAVVREAERYGSGAAIFWGGHENKYIVLPPVPIVTDRVLTGKLDTLPLFEMLGRSYTIGVVLMAWGSYGIGVFEGINMVASKVGTGYIHKRHKKGGSSQKRFARRTEEQKMDFLRKVANRTGEIFGSYTLDYIFFGGNRLILKPLVQECRYLSSEAAKISGRVLDVRYANKETLDKSLSEIMKSVVFTF